MVIGTKMKTDNSNIADLSDKNRPTKLAEAFNELYDNEWTDAFEILQNNWRGSGDKDKGCIRHLYDMLMVYYKLGLVARKHDFVVREQQGRRSDCAPAQSGQRLCYSLIGNCLIKFYYK